MTVQKKKMKVVTFVIDSIDISCQIDDFSIDPGVQDGDRKYTYCGEAYIDETDNEPTLELKGLADHQVDGFTDILWEHQNEVVPFTVDLHEDDAAWHVQFSGNVLIKPPPVGGPTRENERTEVTLQVVGDVTRTRVGA
jgi:hypothetical protein